MGIFKSLKLGVIMRKILILYIIGIMLSSSISLGSDIIRISGEVVPIIEDEDKESFSRRYDIRGRCFPWQIYLYKNGLHRRQLRVQLL